MEMPYKYIQQGWQCPVCGKVYAPWVSECDCHKIEVTGTTTTKYDYSGYTDYAQQESITVGFVGQTNNKESER